MKRRAGAKERSRESGRPQRKAAAASTAAFLYVLDRRMPAECGTNHRGALRPEIGVTSRTSNVTRSNVHHLPSLTFEFLYCVLDDFPTSLLDDLAPLATGDD